MSNDKIVDQLEQRKIQPTSVRMLVLRHFLEIDTAVSLSDLQSEFTKADKSTLYRTLRTFEDHKLIHSIDDGSGQKKYALCKKNCTCMPKDLHYHFHCFSCNKTYCLTNQPIPTIQLPSNFQMQQANMVIKGICGECNL